MNQELQHIVYSVPVLEFMTVSREVCRMFENAQEVERNDFIVKTHKFLSLLYMKALTIPAIEQVNEEGIEKFVTELDWSLIRDSIKTKLAAQDSYLDFYDHMMQETSEPVECSISENLADIYQDLKDFLHLYQLGITDIMNDGLYECKNNFQQYWGQRLIASVRRIHQIIFVEGIDEETMLENKKNIDNCFISKRQQDFRNL